MSHKIANTGSIHVKTCQITQHTHLKADQHILTLASNTIAAQTKPGQFVHLHVSDALPMRRPLSIMSVDVKQGTFELLYKVIGEGTRQLAQRKVGETLSSIGPIGNGFTITGKRPLLIGGGVGIPPMIAIAQSIAHDTTLKPFAILGSEVPFPFDPTPATDGKDFQGATNTMPRLQAWGIPARLASLQGFAGAYRGYVTDLARVYLDKLTAAARAETAIYACGPYPMLAAVARLAAEYDLPCQVSLEENMACAVGGCAGCVVRVQTSEGVAMQRVCVDGPVFEAATVF